MMFKFLIYPQCEKFTRVNSSEIREYRPDLDGMTTIEFKGNHRSMTVIEPSEYIDKMYKMDSIPDPTLDIVNEIRVEYGYSEYTPKDLSYRPISSSDSFDV